MIGVNIGIPVPREPFSFGGLYGTAPQLPTYPTIDSSPRWPLVDTIGVKKSLHGS